MCWAMTDCKQQQYHIIWRVKDILWFQQLSIVRFSLLSVKNTSQSQISYQNSVCCNLWLNQHHECWLTRTEDNYSNIVISRNSNTHILHWLHLVYDDCDIFIMQSVEHEFASCQKILYCIHLLCWHITLVSQKNQLTW